MYLILIYSHFRDVILFLFTLVDGERHFLHTNRNKMSPANLESLTMNITLLHFSLHLSSLTAKELGEIWPG